MPATDLNATHWHYTSMQVQRLRPASQLQAQIAPSTVAQHSTAQARQCAAAPILPPPLVLVALKHKETQSSIEELHRRRTTRTSHLSRCPRSQVFAQKYKVQPDPRSIDVGARRSASSRSLVPGRRNAIVRK